MDIQLPYNWTPRDYQSPLWDYLLAGGLRASAVWHRRAGKDELCLHWTACAAHLRVGNYWHMLPMANQARKAIWEAVNPHTGRRRIDEAFPMELRASTREDQMIIRFLNGSTWQVLGSDNYNSLVGSPPVGLVFSEWALADPSAWAFLRPILLENGGWALFIGTPRGHNHAERTHKLAKEDPAWFGELLTVDNTQVFNPDLLEMERRELIAEHGEDMGQAMFDQEYYCSFNAAVLGAYFSGEMRKLRMKNQISKDVPHIPSLPVHTWWDLGYNDPTAIVFVQFDGPRVLVIDFYQSSGAAISDYAQVLEDKRKEFRYTYGAHVGPHDLEKHELGTGETVRQMAEKAGIYFEVSPKLAQLDSIQHIRNILPRCWFREGHGHMDVLISALEQHHAKYDERTRTLGLKPEHDWTSHPVDAFKYGAQAPSYIFSRTWETEEDMAGPWGGGGMSAYEDELDRVVI